MIIAIHPDNYGPGDASSPTWTRLLCDAGHEVREVDVKRADILSQLRGCHGFMWRWAHFGGMGRIARRLIPVVEQCLKIPTYPSQNTCWHYDDKIAQFYLLDALGIPTPKTWVWFSHSDAREWAVSANYPLVLKLATGAGSVNVLLVENCIEASSWINRLFTRRIISLDAAQFYSFAPRQRLINAVNSVCYGEKPVFHDDGYEAQSGYAYFQEFLPDNEFDTRVTVIGNRAFAFRRFNRDGDFCASGSGKLDYDQQKIDKSFVSLAFDVSNKLGMQSCAIDGLYRGSDPVVCEVSYTYASWAIIACPGYWDSDLNWHEGSMSPEEAQVQDFLKRLQTTGLYQHHGSN